MASTVALARAAAGTGTSLQKILQQSTPGFNFMQAFFKTWLKLDLTTLAAALTIFGTISSALVVLKGLSMKVYWWFTALFTASISIASSDRLNREILNWIGAQVLTRQATRILTARTETIQNDAWHHRRNHVERNDFNHEKRVPIQYLPTFGTTWFIFERNVFLVRRINTHRSYVMGVPDEYAAAPEGDEPLVVMCLGRSVEPIKRYLNACRDFAEKQRESYITVRASKQQYTRDSWDVTILRPIRPLETVHFDETTKAELVADIRNYLDPNTRKFYTARGIPYRRGYLLHGTPGTGKTSLSLALAGYFGLELYLLHLPGVRSDSELETLFTALPPRCIVLLEDIDAVGIKRQVEMTEDEDDDDDSDDGKSRSRCTLSGVLNVIDGVASQEGRIVLMTSNMAHKLDRALIRPGRIDKMIFLDNISQRSAELMFLRMYTPDPSHPNLNLDLKEGELQRLALDFSSAIPDNTFTPAQLQGYLLNHRNSPSLAASEMGAWVADEDRKMEEAKAHAKKVAEWKAKRRQRKTMELLAKTMESADLGAAGKAITQGKAKVETEKGVEAKVEGPVVNGEKKADDGLKDTSEMQGPVVNEESSGDSKEKESTETTDPVINGEKNGDGMKNESTKTEGEQMNGAPSPDEVVIDIEEPTAEKII
ncbi:BCS1 N terminal-domain-containing protein [Hyaloscypha finlandica]|nr:BCS1 N terminal-domain-containing protein [Hyaloscypha sp. PMI_1271]KAH8787755.1 BCS1 N terminal-domain-containing protein [Hyaloscypha finlandica]